MKRLNQPATIASAELAKALLGAWLGGEPTELERELERSCRYTPVNSNPENDAEERERLELLETVAARMKSYPSLLEDKPLDIPLVLCLDLLLHLAQDATPIALPGPTPQICKSTVRKSARTDCGVIRLEIALNPSN